MKYTQNDRIMQVSETTLIIGVDIAKKVHYARAFDWRGIELAKVMSFNTDSTGFGEFFDWANEIAVKGRKSTIIVGFEPTGHYWFTFAQAVLEEGMMVVQVNPYHVKRCKELDDNTPGKNDRKDPKTIAMLVKDGRYQIPYMPKGIYAELRKANNLREEWLSKIWAVKNRVHKWLDTYFPEFLTVFSSWEGKAATLTLEQLGMPDIIRTKTAQEIVSIWREEASRAVGLKRAQKLIDAAENSIGVWEGQKMAKFEIGQLMREYREINTILAELEDRLKEIVLTVPGAQRLLGIKGIGIKAVAGFFAEVGDITRFRHPNQIIKLAGLNLRENSSGTHKGETTISKRGRSRLRALLFRAILPLVAKNDEFRVLHGHYTTRKENPLKKMESMIALCNKLIKIAYKLVIQDVSYDPVKMLGDIRRQPSPSAA